MPQWLVKYRGPDRSQYVRALVAHLFIGKAKHPVPCLSKNCLSLRIVFALVDMDTAIDLNEQSTVRTAKVDDEWTNRVLATKLQPVQTASAQLLP
jgi:hypothetical protein